jgi:hypothetical protein
MGDGVGVGHAGKPGAGQRTEPRQQGFIDPLVENLQVIGAGFQQMPHDISDQFFRDPHVFK